MKNIPTLLLVATLIAVPFSSVQAKNNWDVGLAKYMKSNLETAKTIYQNLRATNNKQYYNQLSKLKSNVLTSGNEKHFVSGTAIYRSYLSFENAILDLHQSSIHSLLKDNKAANSDLQNAKAEIQRVNQSLKENGVQPVSLIFK